MPSTESANSTRIYAEDYMVLFRPTMLHCNIPARAICVYLFPQRAYPLVRNPEPRESFPVSSLISSYYEKCLGVSNDVLTAEIADRVRNCASGHPRSVSPAAVQGFPQIGSQP